MISPSETAALPASTRTLSPSDMRPEADEAAAVEACQRINERRTLEENIEILRRARAL